MAGGVLIRSQTTYTSSGASSIHPKDVAKDSGDRHSLAVPSHPLSIKPAGNAYTATKNIKLAAGLFMDLPDELVIQVLESLDADSLKRLACTCKALYAFSRFEDLWKTLCIEYELLPSHRLVASPHCNLHLELCDKDFHCFGRQLVFSSHSENNVHMIKSQCYPYTITTGHRSAHEQLAGFVHRQIRVRSLY